jgi:hypothetical protein
MKELKSHLQIWVVSILSLVLPISIGCDSGRETIDDITGKKTVEQYEKSKKDIDKAVKKQSERLNSVSGDDTGKDSSEEADEE